MDGLGPGGCNPGRRVLRHGRIHEACRWVAVSLLNCGPRCKRSMPRCRDWRRVAGLTAIDVHLRSMPLRRLESVQRRAIWLESAPILIRRCAARFTRAALCHHRQFQFHTKAARRQPCAIEYGVVFHRRHGRNATATSSSRQRAPSKPALIASVLRDRLVIDRPDAHSRSCPWWPAVLDSFAHRSAMRQSLQARICQNQGPLLSTPGSSCPVRTVCGTVMMPSLDP